MIRIINNISTPPRSLGLLLILCLILVPLFLHARELGEHEVRAAVETWVRYVTADARPDAFVERMEPRKLKGKTVAYIAHLMGGGFCLCGADDMVLPVYLYSPQGTYDPQYPIYQYFLTYIANRTQRLRNAQKNDDRSLDKYRTIFKARERYWTSLTRGSVPERKTGIFDGPAAVTLDLTSLWHQRSPYNDLCPTLTPGADEHCVTGCVANAVAGIMRYWEWPISGVGSEATTYHYRWRTNWDEESLSFDPFKERFNPVAWPWNGRLRWVSTGGGKLQMNGYWDGSLYGTAKQQLDTVSSADSTSYFNALATLWDNLNSSSKHCPANFAATTYRWDLMEDIHDDVIHDAGDTAVATLCYHAGVACEMDYGIFGSGAGCDSAVTAYRNNFRYDDDVEYVVGDTGNYASGVNEMMEEIQWLRPVQYYGWEHVHSWIIFAYNRTFLPDSIQWGMDSGNGSIDWCTFHPIFAYHCFIRHIAPKNVVKFVGASNAGDGTPDDPYRNIEEAIDEAPDYATLIFEAGSDNTFSAAPLVIDRPLTLKGYDVTIRKE